jgi:hypothetical protein
MIQTKPAPKNYCLESVARKSLLNSAWQKTRLFREICPPGSMNAGDFHSELDNHV